MDQNRAPLSIAKPPASKSRAKTAKAPTGDQTRRAKLTATFLNELRGRDKPFEIPDPTTAGLLLHVGALRADGTAGAKSWHLRFSWHGKRVKVTLGQYPECGLADARERARQAREHIDRGIDPRRAGLRPARATPAAPAGAPAAYSVAALADEFMARFITPHRKRPEYVQRILDAEVLPHWKARDARTILPREVIDLLDRIVDRGSPATANRTAGVLSQLFRFGVHRQLVDASPVQLLYRPGGREKPRERVLSDDELAALLRNLDTVFARAPRTAATVRIALLTACRRSELALAKWSDVDLGAGTWRVPPEQSKTGVEYATPLVLEAVAQFTELKARAGRSHWVLPAEDGKGAADPKLLTRSVARHLPALAKIGVRPFTLHDLRRTVRTGLAALRIPPHIAERVLNHAQPGIVAVYDRFAYQDEKRDALTRWAAHLATLEGANG